MRSTISLAACLTRNQIRCELHRKVAFLRRGHDVLCDATALILSGLPVDQKPFGGDRFESTEQAAEVFDLLLLRTEVLREGIRRELH